MADERDESRDAEATREMQILEPRLVAGLRALDARARLSFAIECVERHLGAFTARVPDDARPSEALATYRAFLAGDADLAAVGAAGEGARLASAAVMRQAAGPPPDETAKAASSAATAIFLVSRCAAAAPDVIGPHHHVASFVTLGELAMSGPRRAVEERRWQVARVEHRR